MIFKSISITEGMHSRTISFSEHINLIFSKENSSGKTTLLRLLLYSIGYAVPSTKNINFEYCETKTILETAAGLFTITRHNDYLETHLDDKTEHYILPNDAPKLREKLFGSANLDIVENILGAMYADQEKGWVMLNRGIVVGKIGFNIERLIRGLAEIECKELQAEIAAANAELKKYKQILNFTEYQKTMTAAINDSPEKRDEETEARLATLFSEKQLLSNELERLNRIIHENISFEKFIEKMRIRVKSRRGEEIPVNAASIIGLNDNSELLISKRKILIVGIKKLDYQIDELERIYNERRQIQPTPLLQSFETQIARITIDTVRVKDMIKFSEKRCNDLKWHLSEYAKRNDVATELFETISKYAKEFGVENYIDYNVDYIFTDKLKALSGTVLHLLSFSFRLAFIKAIQEKLGIRLPIILDSPSGREVTDETVDLMMYILKRDFAENQIIIASIYKYRFEKYQFIELRDCLLE
jgi:hypothetical protein